MAHLTNIKEGEDLEEIATTVQQQIMEHERRALTTKRHHRKRTVLERLNIFDLPISPLKASQPSWPLMPSPRSSTNKAISQHKQLPSTPPTIQCCEHRSTIEPFPQPRTIPGINSIQSNTHESAGVRTSDKIGYALQQSGHQLVAEASSVPKLGDKVQAAAATGSSNVSLGKDFEMAEIDGEDDNVQEKGPEHHNQDDVEYFDVEAIMDCKLNSKGMVLLQVKWKDYEDQSDITWEPERVLRNDVPVIVHAFFRRLGSRRTVLNVLRRNRAVNKANLRGRGLSKHRI
ncbi:hypothetical protein B0J14DRAFT_166553 [Halenospora varia]|nr:hypothetical protein B0J14DRAFT_166553 [Halenospora varia]